MTWTTPPPDSTRARAAEHHEHHLHVPAGAHVADRRGLTAVGAVAVAIAVGLIGAVYDLKTGSSLGLGFEIAFVTGTAIGALMVHREDLKAAVILAPYTYCALAVVAGVVGKTSGHGSLLKRSAIALFDALVLHAPSLFLATGLALVIVLVRRASSRRR